MSNKTTVSFVVYDYAGDLDELTDRLGLNPSHIQKNSNDPNDVRRWVLDSGVDSSKDLEDHLSALLSKLSPVASVLKQLAAEARCVISAGIEYYEYNPEIALSPEMLESLASVGAKLWLDIYNMDDESGDEPYSGKGKLEA